MTDHEKFKQIKTNELKQSQKRINGLIDEIKQEYAKYTHNLRLLKNYDKDVLFTAITDLCELIKTEINEIDI